MPSPSLPIPVNSPALFPEPETLTLPESLTGRSGGLRSPGLNTLGAEDDLAAIRAFIVRKSSPNTRSTYSREIQRLWFWAMYDRRRPISALLYEDYLAYRDFLRNPQPKEFWVGRPARRSDPMWRPFFERRVRKGKSRLGMPKYTGGKLDKRSRDLAMMIIRAMLEFWTSSGYIIGNPLASLEREQAKRSESKKKVGKEKILSREQWRGILRALDAMPKESKEDLARWHRARYLTHMLCGLGLRISEMEFKSPRERSPATHAQFKLDPEMGWWLEVTGKGNKERSVPVTWELMQIVFEFREFHGLPAEPEQLGPNGDDSQCCPLLPPLAFVDGRPRSEQGITARRANQILDSIFQAAKAYVSPEHQAGLDAFSAHSFRHTSVSRDLGAGVDLHIVRKKHGHQSIDTTLLYVHDENKEMAAAVNRRRLSE